MKLFYNFLFISFLFTVILAFIHDDGNSNNLLIRVHYPFENLPSNQQTLYIRGDSFGISWTDGVPLTYNGDNTFEISFPLTQEEIGTTFTFKILVEDALWEIGPNNVVVIPSLSSFVDTFPCFFTSEGNYEYQYNVYSPQLKNYRDIVMYLPPSYHENYLKVYSNVLVMHDGQNLFNVSTAFMGNSWLCQDTVNNLIQSGQLNELIIIGVDNTPDRNNELTYSYDPSEGFGGKGDLYLNFIVQTVLPLIQSKYRLQISQQKLGILGSSLGGLISCYAGWTRNNIFGKAGCMSSSFWWNNEDFNNTILNKFSPPSELTVYLDSGNAGPDNDDEIQTQTVRDHIEDLGYVLNENLYYYLDQGGQHSETYWRQRFWVPLKALYPLEDLPTYSISY